MKKAIIITLISISAQTSLADYHYASHEGSNTYPYTSWATAAHLIQDAVDAADRRDTIFVGTGDYYQRVFLHTDSLSLVGMGMDSTRIWYDIPLYIIVRIDSSAYIANIEFEHTDNYLIISPSIFVRQFEVNNCRFLGGGISAEGRALIRNSYFNGEHSYVISGIGDDYLHIENCYFCGADFSPIYSYSDTNIILNNIITTEWGSGIILATGDYVANNLVVVRMAPQCIYMWPRNDGVCLVNNTLDTTSTDFQVLGRGIRIIGENRSITMSNNDIVSGEDMAVWFGGYNSTLYASYNNIWRAPVDFVVDSPSSQVDTSFGLLHEYPMYMGGDDYHLQAFSPLIDAGDPAILDVDGSRSDIGCYGGPGGCSYTYLDMAPLIPDSISAFVDSGAIILSWRYNYEADFNRYQVYRDTIPGFQPSIFDIIAEPDTSYYEDTDILPGTPYYYRLTSVDNQGNISDFSEEIAVIPTSAWDIIEANLPYEPRITSAYPNPFNSNVVIVYSASNLGPQPPQVTLKVYDIQGRVVKTLVDDRIPQGTYRAIWDGTNDSGEPVASGTYIARVSQWDCPGGDFPVKITLIK
ncbi:MAG: right-handed parallel beta-helix repeat-containing protein [Candidatus Zixiibacteriota bacterium]|nr:MAG: right-handed parallel beta-helix repeat-containing protein [candidate division Zixibacteria bacterium]